MSKPVKFDFSGYATKANVRCADGRIILPGAFKENHGTKVPLVWQHLHNEPDNILGHAYLEDVDDGTYTWCVFNDTEPGKKAKLLVKHGDITSLSIYANSLVEKAKVVSHGIIREVSLVLSGANPGATIDFLSMAHGDNTFTDLEDEAFIFSGEDFKLAEDAVIHEDVKEEVKEEEVVKEVVKEEVKEVVKEEVKEVVKEVVKEEIKPEIKEEKKEMTDEIKHADGEETVEDVFNTLNEKQKNAVYAIIGQLMEDENLAQSSEQGDYETMKHNIFESDNYSGTVALTHDQFSAIVADARKIGSFKDSLIQHAVEYGIENIDYLFPDAQTVTPSPTLYGRDTGWVAGVINGTRHSPFSRIKSNTADISADDARALGYVKGSLKKEEIVSLLTRTTTPTTVYKKQKLDRDDIVDIVDLDVVAWLKAEMRVMLDEELARAVLVGDGRDAESADKISETNIRPIYKDADLYVHRVLLPVDAEIGEVEDAIIRSRSSYKGSGSPTMYTTSDFLTDLLLQKDTTGRRLYNTEAELAATLRVAAIVEVPVMENVSRDVSSPAPATYDLKCIMVNLKDYTMGADKGGAVSMFDDFDIDYNQQKYLLETRCSGALTLPKSAVVVEMVAEGS